MLQFKSHCPGVLPLSMWLTFPPTAAAAKSHQSCPTLCDLIDRSPPGSSVPGILQARILEWVAISFSNACNSLGKNTPPNYHVHIPIHIPILSWQRWDKKEEGQTASFLNI